MIGRPHRYHVRMPRYEPIIPEGQRLGTSREHDDAVTGHLFDADNKLQGHAAWRRVDEEESYSPTYDEPPARELTAAERELIEQITALVLALIVLGVQSAAPHVKRWWSDTALPAVTRAWQRVTRRRAPTQVKAETVELLEVVGAEIASAPEPGTALALADPAFTMSSAEWAERYRAMVAAGRFHDEQADILRKARVVDDVLPLAEKDAVELTPRQFAVNVRRMLTQNPELLTDDTAIELKLLLESQLRKRRAADEEPNDGSADGGTLGKRDSDYSR